MIKKDYDVKKRKRIQNMRNIHDNCLL